MYQINWSTPFHFQKLCRPSLRIQSLRFGSSSLDADETTLFQEINQSERFRFMTASEFSLSSQSSNCCDDDLLSNDTSLDLIFKRGLLYHEPGWSFHRYHWAINHPSHNAMANTDQVLGIQNHNETIGGSASSLPFKIWLEVFHSFENQRSFLDTDTLPETSTPP